SCSMFRRRQQSLKLLSRIGWACCRSSADGSEVHCRSQAFCPSKPMHLNSRVLFELYGAPLIKSGAKVLEIGPDKIPTTLQDISHRPGIQWDLLGLAKDPLLQITATSEYEYPIPDGTYDVVVAANVLEHVRNPWVWIRELARVARNDGHVILVNPVSYPY